MLSPILCNEREPWTSTAKACGSATEPVASAWRGRGSDVYGIAKLSAFRYPEISNYL
ncbi:MAG: hypothetical protein L0Y72_10450 [Gemmataceae bacterium]|nr:hypothetical protein [Gemmataceae bacterium]